MDKKLLSHEKFIKAEIGKIEHSLKSAKDNQEITSVKKYIQKLNNYHQKTVRDFQHERLIHLIVTIFFSILLLISIFSVFLFAMSPSVYDYSLLSYLVLAIALILFITDIFYVRYYYRLENGTQRLYELSKKLYDLDNKQ